MLVSRRRSEAIFMILELREFLTLAEVSRLADLSRELRFVEGRLSNLSNVTKDNLQADHGDPKYEESVQIVSAAFARSRMFRDFAFPKRMAPPLLCRYEAGMKYGAHADAAHIVLPNGTLRSDLSCTVFLWRTVELPRRCNSSSMRARTRS